MNTEEFIAKAKSIHGDRYDYSKTVYHYRIPVTIICRVHGEFQSRYDGHIGSKMSGCRKCYNDSLGSNKDEFIKKAKKIHGDTYSYENFDYKSAVIKSSVTCREHGDFKITPAGHLIGGGCPKCRKKKQTSNTHDFVMKASLVHNNKYDYSKTLYVGSNEYVKITCPEHGDFEKTPDNHIHKTRPQGCPKCNEYRGYRDCLPGYLYLFVTKDNKFCKIGISNNPRLRIKRLEKSTPFEFSVLDIRKINDGSKAREWERLFHSCFDSANFTGFDGCTEWFIYDEKIRIWYEYVG